MSKGDGKWLELRRLGIHEFVNAMITGAEAAVKPAPNGLIKCVKALGLSAEEWVYIGDSRLDIRAVEEAGLISVRIETGVAGKELLTEEGPDCIVGEVSEALSWLSGFQENEGVYHGRL